MKIEFTFDKNNKAVVDLKTLLDVIEYYENIIKEVKRGDDQKCIYTEMNSRYIKKDF